MMGIDTSTPNHWRKQTPHFVQLEKLMVDLPNQLAWMFLNDTLVPMAVLTYYEVLNDPKANQNTKLKAADSVCRLSHETADLILRKKYSEFMMSFKKEYDK
jgi:hypothetical protein